MSKFNLELCFRIVFLAELLPLATGACVDLNLGVGSGTIPDSDITASTEQSARSPATNGRLNYTSGSSWCAETSDTNPYLQIDLKSLHIICAVSTQGNSQADQWVKNYTLQISTDETTWTDYKEGGHVKFLRGNDNRNSEVKHVVYGVLTRFLRFLPQTHQGGVCMRLEVFGVEKASTCDSEDIGLASGGTIPDSSFSASSYYDHRSKPSFGRLNGTNRGWEPETKTNLADFLQIDLLYEYVICAVATQGANGISEWTTNYKIQLSMDGITAVTYQETNVDKIFPGNSNQNGIVKNSLREFSSAKFIRFQPTTYHIWKALRVEVYGVLLTKVPSQPPTAFNLTTSSSTSITASWQLPPIFARHGRNITGFKLFYREKCFARCFSFFNITSGSTFSRLVTGLQKYTEYEFQVLAYTSDGDGPKSPVKGERTQGDGCVQYDLGMESGNISDSRITASSSSTPAGNGRLNYELGAPWCAETNDTSPYLQIDLQTLHIVCAVSTQGNSQADQWVKNYTLQISTDGTTWTDYMEGGQVKFMRGNNDRNSEVKHFVYGVLTRYLRFLPQMHQSGVCMRTEVFGVEQKPRCSMQAIGVASTDSIPDSSFSAPSEFNSVYAAKYGRLNGARSWAPNGNNNANDYLQIDLLFDGSTLSRLVTGLEKYTEYIFQVLAYTSKGDGLKSSVEVERAMEDAPSRPPSNFYVTATSSTTVTASWQLPPVDSRNGIIKGFKVFYERKDSSGSGIILTINGGSTFKKNVIGLHKYKEYEFKVLAFTFVGDGPYTSVVVQRTNEDVPSQPPGGFTLTATSSTSITASWQLPPEDSRNGDITGYKLFYKKRGISGPASMQPINDQATRTQEVTGLDKFTEYEFQILAFTAVGDGPNSTAIFKETKEAAPSGPPSLFNVTVNSSTSIRASWHLPREDFRHGIIRGYKLFYKKKGSGLATSLTTDNGNTSKIVTNLDKYTEYEFQVLAFTSVGNGPNTSSVFTRTMEDAPSAPTSLSFVVVPPSNLHGPRITLSWSKPAEPNGVIRSYTLFYSRDGGAPKEDSGLDKDALSHTVDVLGGVTYQFHVRAVTIKPGPNGTITVTTREYSKPFIKGLPKTTTTAIGELVLLKCEFVEETNASLTWTKDGLASIPRAQLENNGKILIIKDVVPGDSGVYECKAINMFGESRTATTVIVAVPPRIIEELSPSTVICQKQSPCFLSCQATSYIPFNYSWTKDGQLPTGDNIKLMNNSLIVSPQVGEDYGEYVCHVTNTFGSTLYEITLLDCEDTQSIFLASVIPLSCIVFVLLLIICGLIWQRRRAVLNKRLQCKEEIDFDGVKSSPDQQSSNEQASGSSTYMELKPMPSNQESRVPSEYQSLQENPENPGYYNTVLHKQNGGKQNEGVYEEI
ncbi:Receptor-type tyrosine-protein phosphatase F [Stylophora pistillata]|uniref:Receptor-type tyrosine-protein phosphatase F n=1 Tax=Stylophora pistillata TaxID=50429 RepID=A0A2B4S4J7_STYPI|nr:Receptor-type tyrosine-protein phosphatase F [Stylophora pistillata]